MSTGDSNEQADEVVVQAGIGEYETPNGDLSATDDQVYFVDESGKTIEIPLDGIVASEYEPASIITNWAYYGLFLLIPGLLAFTIVMDVYEPSFLDPLLSTSFIAEVLLPVTAFMGMIMGALYIASALYYARHTLTIHTAAKSYTFTSNNSKIQRVQDSL